MKTVTIQTRSCGGVEVIHVQNPYVVAVPGEKVKFVNTTSHEAVLTFKDVDSLEATPFSNCDATVTLGPRDPVTTRSAPPIILWGKTASFTRSP